jgi:Fungal protein of unknown function (DUF2011)
VITPDSDTELRPANSVRSSTHVHAVPNASLGSSWEAVRTKGEETVGIDGESGIGTGPDTQNGNDATVAPEAAAGFEFRLFSSAAAPKPKTGTGATALPPPRPRILLDSDSDSTAVDGARARTRRGGFVVPQRPARYYFAAAATPAAKRAFCDAAMTGDAVRALRFVCYTGWEVPWRVMSGVVRPCTRRALASASENGNKERIGKNPRREIPVPGGKDGRSGMVSAVGDVDADVGEVREETVEGKEGREKKRKTRPGKKRRLLLRIRARAADEALARRRREEREREEREREKRTRRNRGKKVRRKEKEKARKGAGAATGDGGNASGDVNS